jgi:hypothetical protein
MVLGSLIVFIFYRKSPVLILLVAGVIGVFVLR